MSTYELDDELVQRFIGGQRSDSDDMALCLKLHEQFPTPAPTKIGAVVQAAYGGTDGVFTRWGTDEQVDRPWIDSTDGEHVQTERLGRITKVLSEGVDL